MKKLFLLLLLIVNFSYAYSEVPAHYLRLYINYKYEFNTDLQILGNDFYKIDNQIFKNDFLETNAEISYGPRTYINADLTDITSTGYFFNKDGQFKLAVFSHTQTVYCQYKNNVFDGRCVKEHPGSEYGDFRKTRFHIFNYYLLTKVKECQPSQHFNTQTKECVSCPNGQQFNPETNKCYSDGRPDWCPAPMLYSREDTSWFSEEYCMADPNIPKDDCKKIPNTSWSPCLDRYGDGLSTDGAACFLRYPDGCYRNEFLKKLEDDVWWNDFSFLVSGFMFPLPDLGFLKGISDSIKNFFKSNPDIPPVNQNLLSYKPVLDDIKITPKGPVPVFDFKPVNLDDIISNNFYRKKLGPDLPLSLPGETYGAYKKRIGLPDNSSLPYTSPITGSKPNVFKFPQINADVSSAFKRLDLPNASYKLDNNSFIVAGLKHNPKPLPTKDLTLPNSFKEVDIGFDLNSIFNRSVVTPSSRLPITIKKVSEAGGVSKFKGIMTTPDKSIINLDIIETTTPNGNKIQDVEFNYDFERTKSNKGKFSTGYRLTIDGTTDKVTNSTLKNSTITDPKTGEMITNTPSSSPVPQNSPDLNSLIESINRTNSKLDTLTQTTNQISNQLSEMWNYKPAHDVNSAVKEMFEAMKKLDVGIQDALNFLNNLKNTIDDLLNQFNEAKNVIEKGIDSPDIPRGSCPFNISGPTPGSKTVQTYEIDPCYLVRPYTSILTIFFTFWFGFEVIMFSLKYLFRPGGDS